MVSIRPVRRDEAKNSPPSLVNLSESEGSHVRFEDGEVTVRALPLRSQRLNGATDNALAQKYTTKSDGKFVEGFKTASRKATTLELVPA